ncbi:solute carrier family 35 member F4-like isoform X3 [Anneissia japonica]|uniref:solute carrier family 35 member F4-like isoform X2 n=1 Tax=Anneissia japonica TaxID=1529436 RepID=UPI001425B5E6|nr:solute carrier family 35 member F4-like isoform X2 [Anneissia japonica]XP_033108323.1 solute carrier family 35 member F4-like isoform X3 [Anneissia japonica]
MDINLIEPDQTEVFVSERSSIKKTVLGFIIVLGIGLSWVGSTQFTKSTYSDTFDAPFFTIWFSTTWMLVCYPGYLLGVVLFSKEKRQAGLKSVYNEDQAVYGSSGLTLWSGLKLTFPFAICWGITNYMYVRALGVIAAADVTALFASNTAFIYILSWVWLEEKLSLLPIRSLSVILSTGGIVLISYADGFGGPTTLGIFLSIGSAIGAAVYKVLFKKYVGDATSGQVSLFLTVLGLCDFVFFWPIMLILYYTDVETWSWDTMPWDYLCGSAALSVVFNFLINFGIAVTYPLFIALGTVVGIPMNAVADLLFRDDPFGLWKIGGTVLIVGGFVLMILPESFQAKFACWSDEDCHRKATENEENQS